MATQEQELPVHAPELTGGRGWLNTDKPLSLSALKGKVVLLDFWTYGCINCMHIIPDLKRLEHKYANQLVVIGVHSAKFENEKDTENIRRIILRYEIEHPIYNDANFTVWRSYGVNAWPTQVLIDPAGYIIGAVSGEGHYQLFDQVIAKTVAEFRKRGKLNEEPLRLALERAKVGDLPLAFPGKVLADAKGDRLFIDVPRGSKSEMFAEAESKFFLKLADVQIRFLKSDKGEISGIELVANGETLTAKKVK